MGALPRANFPDPLLKARSARRLALWRSTVLHPAFVGVAVVVIVGSILQDAWPIGVGVVVVAVLGVAAWADSTARREWWPLLLKQLGCEVDDAHVEPCTPLLRSGDERKVLRAARDQHRRLIIFRSTDVTRETDGTKDRQHHDFTVVLYRDAAPAIRFLSAHEHRARWARWLGDDMRGPTISGVEEFQVESVALHERFELRSSTVDGERARQIFEPSFIVWFADRGLTFEYEGGDLAVIVDRVLEHSEEYRMLLSRADAIHEAISKKGVAPSLPANG